MARFKNCRCKGAKRYSMLDHKVQSPAATCSGMLVYDYITAHERMTAVLSASVKRGNCIRPTELQM